MLIKKNPQFIPNIAVRTSLILLRFLTFLVSFFEYARFMGAVKDPKAAQLKTLRTLLKGLKKSDYYQRHAGNLDIVHYQAFCKAFPIITYEDVASEMKRQYEHGGNRLSVGSVSFYEKTSGSTGSAKLIPYTRSYLKDLNALFVLWVEGIFQLRLGLRSLKTFICVTPRFDSSVTKETSDGSGSDIDYIAPWLGWILNCFLAVPLAVHRAQDPLTYRDLVCLYLISAENLEILSLWSPTLAFALMDHFEENRERLLPHLFSGHYAKWKFKKVSQERRSLLKQSPLPWNAVWPGLKLISCWTEGNARPAAEALKARFPQAYMQGKGLLATEALVSLPTRFGNSPFLHRVFLEGEDTVTGAVLPLWDWQKNRNYRLLISARTGLLRYRLGDIIRVDRMEGKFPLITFLGRDARLADMVGEKLSEDFAWATVHSLLKNYQGSGSFFPIASADGRSCFYAWISDCEIDSAADLARKLDEHLSQAHHYGLARKLGQLEALQVFVSPTWPRRYLQLREEQGLQLGNIKLAAFHSQVFSPGDLRILTGDGP